MLGLPVWPAKGGLFEGPKTVRRDGYTVEEWTAGGLRYAAVSDVDPGDLKAFKAQPLESIRRSSRLEGPAAEELRT